MPPEIDGFAVPTVPELLTPGVRYTAWAKVRPTGRLRSESVSSTEPIVAVVMSIAGDVPVTRTVSETPPTSILSGTSAVWPKLTMTSLCSVDLNPASSALTA